MVQYNTLFDTIEAIIATKKNIEDFIERAEVFKVIETTSGLYLRAGLLEIGAAITENKESLSEIDTLDNSLAEESTNVPLLKNDRHTIQYCAPPDPLESARQILPRKVRVNHLLLLLLLLLLRSQRSQEKNLQK